MITTMSVFALKDQRMTAYKRATAILDRVGSRELSDAELSTVQAAHREMDRLNEQIHEAEKREAQAPRRTTESVVSQRTEFESFGEQAMAIVNDARRPGLMTDPRLTSIQAAAASGASTVIDTEGGFLLEPQWTQRLLDRTYQLGQILKRCTRTTLARGKNELKIVTPLEASRANGSRWGGLQIYWPDEGNEITGSKPKLRTVTLKPHTSAALCTVTGELAEDAAGLEMLLTKGFTEEMQFVLEDLIINNDGLGKPLGILKSPALITISKETAQAAATILGENVIKMYARFWVPGRENGIWICNQDVETQLLTNGLTYGGKVMSGWYVPASDGETYGRLLGLPLIPVEYCPTLGQLGDLILIDPAEYVIAEKPLNTAVSLHVRFINYEPVFRFTYRVDGSLFWSSALTPKNGSLTVAPCVALAERS